MLRTSVMIRNSHWHFTGKEEGGGGGGGGVTRFQKSRLQHLVIPVSWFFSWPFFPLGRSWGGGGVVVVEYGQRVLNLLPPVLCIPGSSFFSSTPFHWKRARWTGRSIPLIPIPIYSDLPFLAPSSPASRASSASYSSCPHYPVTHHFNGIAQNRL